MSNNLFLLSIKMSLKFGEIKVSKKEFHKSKQPIYSDQVEKIDSVIKLEDDENYPHVNLEQCKYRLKKRKFPDLFDDELKDSSDESEIESE